MYKLEITDTFGGEANYCWVKRGSTKATSRRGVVKAIKDLAGWTGWCRVRVTDYGDMIEVRPTQSSGVCQVAFATWSDV
jgi:hypothetical protein